MRRSSLQSVVASAFAVAVFASAGPAAAEGSLWLAGEGLRVARDASRSLLSRGEGNPLAPPGADARLGALRGETVAFSAIVEASGEPLDGVTIEVEPAGAPQQAGPSITVTRLVEHYVEVRVRSRNEQRPDESLGWLPGARPPDAEMLGWIPDALIPLSHAPPWAPYPLAVPAGQTRAVWVDLFVPEQAAPGEHRFVVRASAPRLGEIAARALTVTVKDALLPYRAASALVYYDPEELQSRLGETDAPERQLWQLLHAHHLDALPGGLTNVEAARRLGHMLDGSLFTGAHGYHGPGVGVTPAAVALGAYGELGEARPESLARVRELLPLVGGTGQDLFLYAVDETCDSPRGPDWRRAIQAEPPLRSIAVGHTCSEDPRKQDVDLVMMSAQGFQTRAAAEARDAGKKVWIYNGQLPHAGTFMLDAPPTSLTLNGWIASAYEVGRWFYWGSTFWGDGNKGGRGPVDPFTQPESFHNKDGDACLLDGLLVYPGIQKGAFAARSLGLSGVVPSMRLKALRRGIEDAGLVALARATAPAATEQILARVVPAALDDADADGKTPFELSAQKLAEARDELRALAAPGASLDEAAAAVELRAAASRRRETSTPAVSVSGGRKVVTWVIGGGGLVITAVMVALFLRKRRSSD